VVNIMRRLKLDKLYHWWDSAYKLHVDGFHDAKLKSNNIRLRLKDVESLVNLAKRYLRHETFFKTV